MIPTTVTSIDAAALDMPLIEPFAIAKGAPAVAANVLVKVTLADGTVGLGEAAPFTAVSGETQKGTVAAIDSVRASFVGQDARRYRALALRLGEALGAEPSARCALETAILDALTRHARLPLWAFFGGRGTELETDMTITAGDARHAAAAAVACLGRGIQTLKIKVGAAAPTLDAERVAAVHRAVPGAKLLADANGGYTPEQAAQFVDELVARQVPLELFEQPVEREQWLAFAELRRSRPAMPVAICADESARSAADVLHLIREGAVDAVNIKPMKSGVVESLAIWDVATAAGLDLMIGGMLESVLAMSFSVHFAAGLGGFKYVDLDTPMFIAEHPFTGGFEQDGARLSVARVEAGHGVTLPRP
jgi:L-alanine-DL-glutamate epimerase-like enolase superfamily enzyme